MYARDHILLDPEIPLLPGIEFSRRPNTPSMCLLIRLYKLFSTLPVNPDTQIPGQQTN